MEADSHSTASLSLILLKPFKKNMGLHGKVRPGENCLLFGLGQKVILD